jgi:hypothetical protein
MGRFSIDQLEQRLADDERLIARIRARQIQDLAELDRAQVATADGSRSMSEWLAARIDVSIDTSRSLVRTMRRLQDHPRLMEQLESGETTFDRVEALSRIAGDVGHLEWTDVSGVHREAAKRARITADAEQRSAADRFLVMQPSLDASWWKFWGGLDGHSGVLVDKVLNEASDRLPEVEGMLTDSSWKRATALVQCLVSDAPPPAQLTVMVDARHAAETNGEAGVSLDAGSRVGRQTLQAILCDSITEIVARTEDGRYMDYGRRERTAPPALKRALIAEAGFRCAADGCVSRHRLQIHHLTPWSEGGETNQDELVVLCWYHHQVVVHGRGFRIIFHPDRRRIRFKRPDRGPPA